MRETTLKQIIVGVSYINTPHLITSAGNVSWLKNKSVISKYTHLLKGNSVQTRLDQPQAFVPFRGKFGSILFIWGISMNFWLTGISSIKSVEHVVHHVFSSIFHALNEWNLLPLFISGLSHVYFVAKIISWVMLFPHTSWKKVRDRKVQSPKSRARSYLSYFHFEI